MQLGMIGLGRMGANMVRRLLKGGHQCVVFDMSPKVVTELVAEKAPRQPHRSLDFVKKLHEAAGDLVNGSGGGHRPMIADLLPHLEAGDILIDGGNSYYVDDIRRAKELAVQGHSLCGCRDERRGLGTRTGLLHDDRRREARSSNNSIPSSRRWRRVSATSRARRDARRSAAPRSRVICTAGPAAPATSSRWCTTALNTASWPPMPRGSTFCRQPISASRPRRRCGDDAPAPPGTLSVRVQASAKSRRCGGVEVWWLHGCWT